MTPVTNNRNVSAWLDAIATTADLPPDAVRIAVAVAAHRSADLAALVDRLGLSSSDAAAAVDALVAAGFVRTCLEPVMPPGAPRPSRLSPAAWGALNILCDLGLPCHVETWRTAFVGTMPDAAPAARRQAWHRVRLALVAAELVAIDADGIVTAKEAAR